VTASATISVTASTPFTLSASPSSLAFVSGATTGNASTITLTSLGGFTGAVNLTCLPSVSNAVYQPTCTVAPLSVSGSGTAVLTIKSTTAVTQTSVTKLGGFAEGWSLAALVLAMAGLLIPAGRRRSLRALRVLPLLALLGLAASTLSGCGSGGNTVTTPHQTTTSSSAGSYTVVVTGTSATNSALTATTSVAVTIQ
jgi:hypothetical protein